jgi:thiol:disulfide interchange protein DsbC
VRRILLGSLLAAGLALLPVMKLSAQLPSPSPSAEEFARAASVSRLFAQRFGPTPDGVTLTPYGLFEVRLGNELVYTDEKVSFVLDGVLIDAATRRNVTQERIERLTAVKFDELPLNLAIRQVNGKGTRQLAVFEDPNCGYCKQLRRALAELPDVTLYTFVYPILSPDSLQKSRIMMCSSNPGRAWDDWMIRGRTPTGRSDCDTSSIERTLELGRKLNVRGTPALIFGDGTRVNGAIPPDQLRSRLEAHGRKPAG